MNKFRKLLAGVAVAAVMAAAIPIKSADPLSIQQGMIFMFLGGGPPLVAGYRGTYNSTATSSTFTFNNCDFGPAAANRVVHVFVVSHDNNNPTPVTASCTIGGQAVTADVNATGNRAAALFRANVASGDTGTVFITMSGSDTGCLIHVWSGYPSSATPVDVVYAEDNSTSITATDVAKTNGGYTIIGVVHQNALTTQGTITQTGAETIIEGYDDAPGGVIRSTAGFHLNTATTTGDDYSQTVAASNEHRIIVGTWF